MKTLKIKGIEESLAKVSVFSSCGLFAIWVLPETIALRHFLLGLGALVGASLVFLNRRNMPSFHRIALTLGSLFFLFAWVGIHFFSFSMNPDLELSEIKGLWLRSFMGCIAAVGLGISLRNFDYLKKYFFIAMFLTPAINLASYFYAAMVNKQFLLPNSFVRFLFTKIETAYFGAVSGSLAVANLVFISIDSNKSQKIAKSLIWVLAIAALILSATVSSSKNGVIAIILLVIYFLIALVLNTFFKFSERIYKNIVLGIITAILVCGSFLIHANYSSPGWGSITSDALVALNTSENTQWQMAEGSVATPNNNLGIPAAVNTYYRVAWAKVGAGLIMDYPLGYGSINRSFYELQKVAGINNVNLGQTHSGWIDFGLAFGLPGLGILFTCLLSILYFSFKNLDTLSLFSIFFVLIIIPFGLIAEICWKQYFEATLYFISLTSTLAIYRKHDSVNG